MPRSRVLLLGEIENSSARASWESLSSLAELSTSQSTNRDEFFQECRSGMLDGVIAVYRTFSSIAVTGRWDEELLKELPSSLKFVCHNGAGYDQIDIAAATSHSIHVSNVPTAVDDATADTAVFLILSTLRKYSGPIFALRRHEWRGIPPVPLGHDPEGKVLGILGMGGIGRNLKKKMEAFSMKVQYHNRNKLSDELSAGARYVEFEELLKTSDVLSLNLPLNANTRHIISTPQFALMKPGVVIVNTARGGVMDEAALVKALNDGTVTSVGLDVYEEEPEIHPGLVENENVMLLPHLGTNTVETQTAMEQWNIDNIRTALETGKLKSPVSEQANMPYN